MSIATPASAVIGVPISQLEPADLPLVGDEQLVLVQDGVTKRVASSEVGSGTGGSVVFESVVSPAALPAGQTDDWSPVTTDASRVRVDAAGDFELSGFLAAEDGRFFWLVNVSDFNMTILSESAGSLATNRFACNGDLIVPPNCKIGILYDTSIGRWSAGG